MIREAYRKQQIRLSVSTGLNLFRECPRCFWLHHKKKVPRPRGIFPSLPGGMDRVIKRYFDHYRGMLPPELRGKIHGTLLPDQALMDEWRDWRSGLVHHDQTRNASLIGALDDCLINGDRYTPLDYKTRGSAPRPGDSEKYYQLQLDSYALLLQANGLPPTDFGYLVYYYPHTVEEGGVVRFTIEPVQVAIDPRRAQHTFEEAVSLLLGQPPLHHSHCEYCFWLTRRQAFE